MGREKHGQKKRWISIPHRSVVFKISFPNESRLKALGESCPRAWTLSMSLHHLPLGGNREQKPYRPFPQGLCPQLKIRRGKDKRQSPKIICFHSHTKHKQVPKGQNKDHLFHHSNLYAIKSASQNYKSVSSFYLVVILRNYLWVLVYWPWKWSWMITVFVFTWLRHLRINW